MFWIHKRNKFNFKPMLFLFVPCTEVRLVFETLHCIFHYLYNIL